MTSHDVDTVLGWRGRTVLDRDGDKIGTLGEVYLDGSTDLPAWAGVRSGLLGRRESLVPLDGIEQTADGDLRVPWEKDAVTSAPDVDAEVDLDEAGERRLFEHYGRPYDDAPAGSSAPGDAPTGAPGGDRPAAVAMGDGEAAPAAAGEGRAAPAAAGEARPATSEGGAAEVVRSEEEPVVTNRTERRPVERLKLKKVLVTEHVEQKVPVRREVVEVDDGTAPGGTGEGGDRP